MVVSNGVDVVRLSADGSEPVRIATEGRAVDTADDASIWVVDPLATGQPSRAIRVDLDGTVRDRIRLPAVARAYAGTVDGLVVWVPGGIVEVSGSASRTLTGGGEPAAVDGVRLARTDCAEALTCQVVIGALDDPDGGVRVPLAAEDIPGGFFGLRSGTFSPDGSRLALPIYRVDGRGGLRSTRVAVIDTVTGVEGDPAPPVRILRAADTALAWSPNGRWLVIGAAGGLTIWDAQRSEAHEIELPARVTGALLVPTPS